MRGVVADANCEGHLRRLIGILTGPDWNEFWMDLEMAIVAFADIGLSATDPDHLVWRTCQREQIALITGNRNLDDPTSLEATIRNESQADSLPVFTIGTVDRILTDRAYAERVASDLLESLIQIKENPRSILGSGRVYLPKNEQAST